jgi:hypothetical protein
MKTAWETEWGGNRIYIEVITSSVFEGLGKAFFWGLFGRPKTRSMMLYGRELVAQREVKEPLGWFSYEFDLVGAAHLSSGHEANFHAVVTLGGIAFDKCHLSVDGEEVPLQKIL